MKPGQNLRNFLIFKRVGKNKILLPTLFFIYKPGNEYTENRKFCNQTRQRGAGSAALHLRPTPTINPPRGPNSRTRLTN